MIDDISYLREPVEIRTKWHIEPFFSNISSHRTGNQKRAKLCRTNDVYTAERVFAWTNLLHDWYSFIPLASQSLIFAYIFELYLIGFCAILSSNRIESPSNTTVEVSTQATAFHSSIFHCTRNEFYIPRFRHPVHHNISNSISQTALNCSHFRDSVKIESEMALVFFDYRHGAHKLKQPNTSRVCAYGDWWHSNAWTVWHWHKWEQIGTMKWHIDWKRQPIPPGFHCVRLYTHSMKWPSKLLSNYVPAIRGAQKTEQYNEGTQYSKCISSLFETKQSVTVRVAVQYFQYVTFGTVKSVNFDEVSRAHIIEAS